MREHEREWGEGRRDQVEQGNAPVDDGAKEAGVGRPSSANPRLLSPFKLPTHGPLNNKTLTLLVLPRESSHVSHTTERRPPAVQ
jgi:hypothetical protein